MWRPRPPGRCRPGGRGPWPSGRMVFPARYGGVLGDALRARTRRPRWLGAGHPVGRRSAPCGVGLPGHRGLGGGRRRGVNTARRRAGQGRSTVVHSARRGDRRRGAASMGSTGAGGGVHRRPFASRGSTASPPATPPSSSPWRLPTHEWGATPSMPGRLGGGGAAGVGWFTPPPVLRSLPSLAGKARLFLRSHTVHCARACRRRPGGPRSPFHQRPARGPGESAAGARSPCRGRAA